MSLFITYVSSTCFGPHRSIIRSVLQAVFADLQIWYDDTRSLQYQRFFGCENVNIGYGKITQFPINVGTR